MRRQIRGAGICQIVTAVLELLFGGLYLLLGTFSAVFEGVVGGLDLEPSPAIAEPGIATAAMGAFTLAVGIVRLAAGIQHLDVRGRTLGIVIAIVGVLNIGNCMCVPVSLIAIAWVLVVFLDGDSVQAFRERAEGDPAQVVLDRGLDPLGEDGDAVPPRQVHDRAIADQLVRCLPREWDEATLHVAIPRDRTSDRLGLEIEGPPGARQTAEPSRELTTAVQRFVAFARMHRREFDTLSYTVARDELGEWALDAGP